MNSVKRRELHLVYSYDFHTQVFSSSVRIKQSPSGMIRNYRFNEYRRNGLENFLFCKIAKVKYEAATPTEA